MFPSVDRFHYVPLRTKSWQVEHKQRYAGLISAKGDTPMTLCIRKTATIILLRSVCYIQKREFTR